MIVSGDEKERLLLPRWRSLARAMSSGELAFPRRKGAIVAARDGSTEFYRRMAKWRLQPSIISAAEVVESSLIEGLDYQGNNAARWLARPESHAAEMVRNQALRLLSRTEGTSVQKPESEDSRLLLGQWRDITREYPEDPLAWTELALWQVTNGLVERAKRSILVALQLAPESRYVLRSAVRFFIHAGEPDRGYDLLRNNPRTAHDPWLLAGEIAVSRLAARSPRYWKAGSSVLDADMQHPRQISELAGAIATVHLLTGRDKKARKIFRQSLLDPTGNSLAQAQWASESLHEDLVAPTAIQRVRDSFEVKTMLAFRRGDFAKVLDECHAWLADEPYSIRPALTAASAAISTGDYEKAEQFASRAYFLNRANHTARNNFALVLACIGQFERAERVLGPTEDTLGNTPTSTVMMATRGLICLRKGDHAQGVALYERAIKGFKLQGLKHHETLALAYYAREAQIARLPNAAELLDRSVKAVQSTSLPQALAVVEEAKKLAEGLQNEKTESR